MDDVWRTVVDLRSVAVLFLWEGGEREKYAREACAACRRGFVGGWLLGSPPAESVDRQHTPHGLAFQGGR